MYSTCIFCHANLGTNEAIEHFPVGRRLVFDSARGRLWVVCRSCERWNLSPLEDRWEAIEECEGLFRSTRLRVSTDNIGLARIREGLELVRVGSPLRPEMAAWRYGDQFGRRRRKHLAYISAGVVVSGLVVVGSFTGVVVGGSVLSLANSVSTLYRQRRARAHIVLPEFDRPVALRLEQIQRTSIARAADGWGIRLAFVAPTGDYNQPPGGGMIWSPRWSKGDEIGWLVTGDAALTVAGKVLPAINAAGAKRDHVESAVRLIGEEPDPARLFARYAWRSRVPARGGKATAADSGHLLTRLPTEVRLALEMTTHEDSERRALDGELALLETEWRRAEEIAAIADDMLVSDQTRAKLAELKRDDRR